MKTCMSITPYKRAGKSTMLDLQWSLPFFHCKFSHLDFGRQCLTLQHCLTMAFLHCGGISAFNLDLHWTFYIMDMGARDDTCINVSYPDIASLQLWKYNIQHVHYCNQAWYQGEFGNTCYVSYPGSLRLWKYSIYTMHSTLIMIIMLLTLLMVWSNMGIGKFWKC
jgi:hypothetical protein